MSHRSGGGYLAATRSRPWRRGSPALGASLYHQWGASPGVGGPSSSDAPAHLAPWCASADQTAQRACWQPGNRPPGHEAPVLGRLGTLRRRLRPIAQRDWWWWWPLGSRPLMMAWPHGGHHEPLGSLKRSNAQTKQGGSTGSSSTARRLGVPRHAFYARWGMASGTSIHAHLHTRLAIVTMNLIGVQTIFYWSADHR
jgi:hypothetical protein